MKIISGGQTGADRGALDAARAAGFPTGGQAPSNYWTERGPDPGLAKYGLTAGGSLVWRTERNVRAADATVIFQTHASPGSDLTARLARRYGKPVLVLDPWAPDAAAQLRRFLQAVQPGTLNVAGHRESKAPGIGRQVFQVLTQVFSQKTQGVPE